VKTKLPFWLLATVLVVTAFSAQAQPQSAKIPVVGVLWGSTPRAERDRFAAFQHGLQALGYAEGKTILVEHRYAEGKLDKFPEIVAELVQIKVDVMVAAPLTAIRAAKEATQTIPIVMVTSVDPVASRLVESLARPGGNLTGLTRLGRDLSGKRLELLKEVVPEIAAVGVLRPGGREAAAISFKEYETASRALKIQIRSFEVRGPSPDFESVIQAAAKVRVSALVVITEPVVRRYAKQLAEVAMKHRLPSMCEATEYVEAGCLMSYMTSDTENFRRAAIYVDRILKGANPADLPVEQPTKFEFVVNLKTAKEIRLTIPQSVLYRADRVIR
jgi:putative tryptophan/tyrosine transport system substrate-binding protein